MSKKRDDDGWDSIAREPLDRESARGADAMYAVYHNAFVQDFKPPLDESERTRRLRDLLQPPMPLDEALETIRLRAIEADTEISRNRLRRAIRVLGSKQFIALDLVHVDARAQIEEAVGFLEMPINDLEAWSFAGGDEDAVPEQLRSTCIRNVETDVDPSAPTKITIRSIVDRPLEQIRRHIDPQGWDNCSRFFQSCRIWDLRDGTGHPGEPWKGVLRERVGGRCWSALTKLLVEYEIEPSDPTTSLRQLRAEYELEKSGPIYNNGIQHDDELITKDSGHYSARRIDGTSSALEVEKTLEWAVVFPRELIPLMLNYWCHELAEEGPCCLN